MDSLYWHYTECHAMTNAKTKRASRALNAYLVSVNAVDYKAKSRKYTTMGCGLRPRKPTTLGGVFDFLMPD